MQPKEDKHKKLRDQVDRIFSDDLMMGLAMILVGIVILPIVYSFSHAMIVIFDYANYIIIFAFVAEYVLKLYAAEFRKKYVLNLWHILDLIIIIIALLDLTRMTFLPYLILEQGKLSPVLRLLRVLLAISLAGRTAERVTKDKTEKPPEKPPNLQISILDQDGNFIETQNRQSIPLSSKDEPQWIDLQYVSTDKDINYIDTTFHVKQDMLKEKLIKESFPRIECVGDNTSIFLWDTRLEKKDDDETTLDMVTNDMLIICTKSRILTISTQKSELFNSINNEEKKLSLVDEEFPIRILYAILQQKIRDYGDIVRRIEKKTLEFEDIPVSQTSPQFLENTFHFRKEIQKIISNLWHFKQILEHIKDNKVALNGFDGTRNPAFDSLHDDAEYIWDTANNTKESLISLIELHINTVSYDMNRVMKMIAVITCLAIVPSIIGGLLGENLVDQPYQITISEVFFLVASLMLMGLYVFYKKNWL